MLLWSVAAGLGEACVECLSQSRLGSPPAVKKDSDTFGLQFCPGKSGKNVDPGAQARIHRENVIRLKIRWHGSGRNERNRIRLGGLPEALYLSGARAAKQSHSTIDRNQAYRLGLKRIQLAVRVHMEHGQAASRDAILLFVRLRYRQFDRLPGVLADPFLRTAKRGHMTDQDRLKLSPELTAAQSPA